MEVACQAASESAWQACRDADDTSKHEPEDQVVRERFGWRDRVSGAVTEPGQYAGSESCCEGFRESHDPHHR